MAISGIASFRGIFLYFFPSFVVFHVSGAPVTLTGKIAYYSYQLYSDCSHLFVFFIYIFRNEVTPKLYLCQHFNFQTYLFCFILLLIYTWVFHHGMCSICSLFLPFSFTAFSYAYQAYFGILPYLLYWAMFVAIPHCIICVCVCVYSLTLESWNLSGELIKTHIAGTNFRVFI